MAATLALFSLAVVVASLLGGLLPLATVLTHTRLQIYLSFAAGTMLGAAFFHMMPEAVEPEPARALAWTAAGLLSIFLLERFFAFHQHEPPSGHHHGHAHDHEHACHDHEPGGRVELQWKVAAFGLTIHSLAGGVALASAAVAGLGPDSAPGSAPGIAAWGVFIATVVHKPADALTITSLMVRAGASRFSAHLVNLAFALMIPLGMALFLFGLSRIDPGSGARLTSATLAFSAGTFLCIALSDLLPELQFHDHDRVKLSLAMLAGVGLMALAALWA
jgi:zinc and cadmium transporter